MLTDARRAIYYQALGLSPAVIREVEEMRLESPSRRASQRGLKNILVDFYSARNADRRLFESYNVPQSPRPATCSRPVANIQRLT